MHFLNFPPLWFLRGAPPVATSVDVCVSVTYLASIGVDVLDSVDIELSALAYGFSAIFADDEPELSPSVKVAIDLDDISFSSLDLRTTVTPIFQLTQSGLSPIDVVTTAKVSISVTASIFTDVTPSLSYNVSASVTASILVFGQIEVCVSSDYRISVEPLVLLNAQSGQNDVDLSFNYGVSTSIAAQVAIIGGGGLVWSRSKQMYIPVRVG